MTTETSTALHAELDGYRKQFEAAKRDVGALVEGLSEEEFNRRPGEGQWSIAECLDHLTVLGSLMMRKIDEGIEKGAQNGWKSDGPFKHSWLGNKFVAMVGSSEKARRRKLKAPAAYTPSSNHSIGRLHEAFTEVQDQFIERVHKANGLDLSRVKIPSPVTRLLRFSLGQWFALLAGHQERHFAQAQEVRAHMESAERREAG